MSLSMLGGGCKGLGPGKTQISHLCFNLIDKGGELWVTKILD